MKKCELEMLKEAILLGLTPITDLIYKNSGGLKQSM
jgi:hypothetical protein